MLGRSAWGLFWMFRYLERAENTARMLDAGFRMALTRGLSAASDEWRSVLITLGLEEAFAATGLDHTGHIITNFVLRSPENADSVLAMMENARTNARMVRTAITREVWEATNESWMILKDLLARPVREADLGEVLDTIRRQTMLVRGAMEGTMLRNDIYNFAYMGTHIERADNTARILDVKYHVLLPSLAWVGSRLDNAQWEMVLRSVSGERAFRWMNAGALDPKGIAEFLILDGRFPRSLAFAMTSWPATWRVSPMAMARRRPRTSCCVRRMPDCSRPALRRSSNLACTSSSPSSSTPTARSPTPSPPITASPSKAGAASCASPSATPRAIASMLRRVTGCSACGCARANARCRMCWNGRWPWMAQ
jgi:uncharacterized alpha-E superfamily protein